MTFSENRKKIVDEFRKCQDWEERYKKIIEYGKSLPEMDAKYKTDENFVKGCQSQVWLHAELDKDNKLNLQADSDALIVKGLIAVVLQVYNHQHPKEILENPFSLIQELGFSGHLSPNRANGLASMIKKIFHYATAYQYLINSKKNI